MARFLFGLLSLCVVCAPLGSTYAQDEEAGAVPEDEASEPESEAEEEAEEEEEPKAVTAWGFPLRFAARPLVMDKGMVRADGRVTVGGVPGGGTLSALDLGGAVSPVENLELGASSKRTGAIPAPGGNGLITAIFSPSASYGDIPIYGRYQFHRSDIFIAAVDLVLVLPTNTDFTLTAGVPMRVVEILDLFTMDINIDLRYRAGDKYAAFVTDPAKATFDFTWSGAGTLNVTDHGFVEIGGGVGVVNVNGSSDARNILELPFFVGGGYTYEGKDRLLVDFFLQFGFLPLMTANQPAGRDTFNIPDDWFVTVGATIYTKPLFGE